MANRKEQRKAKQAAAQAAETTTTTTNPTQANNAAQDNRKHATEAAKQAKPRTAAPKSPAVVEAEAKLAQAKADAKAARLAAKADKPKPEPRPTCTATKLDGSKCTAKAKTGSMVCVDHQPAWDRLTGDEQASLTLLFETFTPAQAAQLLVSEVGWHRAKAVVKAI